MVAKTPSFVGQQISYRFNNGVPNQLTQRVGPTIDEQPHAADGALRPGSVDAQAADAARRPALRARAQLFPAGENGVIEAHRVRPGVHLPAHRRRHAATTTSRRAWAASYDLFGNGKTALKVSFSKYLQAAYNGDVYTINNPGGDAGARRTSRGWTDTNNNRASPTAIS